MKKQFDKLSKTYPDFRKKYDKIIEDRKEKERKHVDDSVSDLAIDLASDLASDSTSYVSDKQRCVFENKNSDYSFKTKGKKVLELELKVHGKKV